MRDTMDAKRWNELYPYFKTHFRHSLISEYHEREQTKLLEKWICGEKAAVLITDLFNESFGNIASLQWLLANGCKVIGMDISSNVISKIKSNKLLNIPCVVCDVRRLPFKSKTFNYVISLSTLDHFDEKDFQKSLRDINRVLVLEGELVATLHNAQNMFLYFYLIKLKNELPFPMECYSIKRSAKIIEECNFRIKETEAIVHILFPRIMNIAISWCSKHKKHKMLKIINKLMEIFRYLGRWKTKYFTCKFIALCAVKVQ